jgi:molybdopterin/thiamine biosynthesis adenylyltransferase
LKERYARNLGTLTPQEIALLGEKRVFIAGCGGLGGYVLEMLARIGILNISIADGDVFSASNLNRQLLCTEDTIGMPKTEAALLRIKEINPEVKLIVHPVCIDEKNAAELLAGHDVIIDALDNVPIRLLLEKYAETLGMPLIHGAIHGWLAQIAVIQPGDRTLEKLYGGSKPAPPSVPSFTPAFCASMQVSETIKLLLGKETAARGNLMLFDLYSNDLNIFSV